MLCCLIRTACEAVLMRLHNIFFMEKDKKLKIIIKCCFYLDISVYILLCHCEYCYRSLCTLYRIKTAFIYSMQVLKALTVEKTSVEIEVLNFFLFPAHHS